MKKHTERDAKIAAVASEPGCTLSYEQIGAMFGVSKGTVSGVMFRHNKPHLKHTSRPPNPRPKVRYAGAER